MSAEEATEDEYFKAVNIFFSLKSSYETKIKNDRKNEKKCCEQRRL